MNSKNTYRIALFANLLVLVCFLFNSCVSSFAFQKRKYTRGVYVAHSEKKHQVKTKSILETSSNGTDKPIDNEIATYKILSAENKLNTTIPIESPQPVASTIFSGGFNPAHIFKTVQQTGVKVVSTIKKQSVSNAERSGVIGTVFKIFLALLVIVILGMIIMIIVLAG